MPTARYRGPPMTLANMRAQGVRSLWVVCDLCHDDAVLKVDRFGDDVPVPAFGPRMVCTPAASLAHSRGRIGRRPNVRKPDRAAVELRAPRRGWGAGDLGARRPLRCYGRKGRQPGKSECDSRAGQPPLPACAGATRLTAIHRDGAVELRHPSRRAGHPARRFAMKLARRGTRFARSPA